MACVTLGALMTALLPDRASAGNYSGLCGGTKCNLSVNEEAISSPYVSIPTSRVTSWGGDGDSSTSVGTGVVTTLFFGPIGLLGFLAKKHDYNFLINGYDAQGRKSSIQIKFKSDKPAKRLIVELGMVTGLGMAQKRSAKEIRQNERRKGLGDLGRFKDKSGLYEDNSLQEKCFFGWCRQ